MAQHQLDQLWVTNPTDKPFTVHWAGVPYTLEPGKRIVWMRFLAEHFAKRLADAILLKREEDHRKAYQKTGKPMSEYIMPSYLNSKRERPPVVDSILVGVYQYHTPQSNDPNTLIQQQIQQMNQNVPAQEEKHTDMGAQADPLLGVLHDDDDESTAQDEPQAENPPVPTTETPPDAEDAAALPMSENPLVKRNRLIREARQLGVKVTPTMTNEQLLAEIQKQYA